MPSSRKGAKTSQPSKSSKPLTTFKPGNPSKLQNAPSLHMAKGIHDTHMPGCVFLPTTSTQADTLLTSFPGLISSFGRIFEDSQYDISDTIDDQTFSILVPPQPEFSHHPCTYYPMSLIECFPSHMADSNHLVLAKGQHLVEQVTYSLM